MAVITRASIAGGIGGAGLGYIASPILFSIGQLWITPEYFTIILILIFGATGLLGGVALVKISQGEVENPTD